MVKNNSKKYICNMELWRIQQRFSENGSTNKQKKSLCKRVGERRELFNKITEIKKMCFDQELI